MRDHAAQCAMRRPTLRCDGRPTLRGQAVRRARARLSPTRELTARDRDPDVIGVILARPSLIPKGTWRRRAGGSAPRYPDLEGLHGSALAVGDDKPSARQEDGHLQRPVLHPRRAAGSCLPASTVRPRATWQRGGARRGEWRGALIGLYSIRNECYGRYHDAPRSRRRRRSERLAEPLASSHRATT